MDALEFIKSFNETQQTYANMGKGVQQMPMRTGNVRAGGVPSFYQAPAAKADTVTNATSPDTNPNTAANTVTNPAAIGLGGEGGMGGASDPANAAVNAGIPSYDISQFGDWAKEHAGFLGNVASIAASPFTAGLTVAGAIGKSVYDNWGTPPAGGVTPLGGEGNTSGSESAGQGHGDIGNWGSGSGGQGDVASWW